MSKTIRIGGASGFWGDAVSSTPQLLQSDLDYLVYDYLAEITMAILARMRAKDPEKGYATDFVTGAMAPNLKAIAAKGVKVISNAGGVNPAACAAALREEISKQGIDLKVACIEGDDLMDRVDDLAARQIRDMFSDAAFPDAKAVGSVNAYIGGFPIARALARGADIVVTGRCVDSATTLGACIHEFGWTEDMLDELAGGSLAGHIIECGPQATGGNFTDWRLVADRLADIGYPIAEVMASGDFRVTKPEGTGGLVSVGTVSEQMLYEIGDPQAYRLPDVTCDFSMVRIDQAGDDLVAVSGAQGTPPSSSYKTCLTFQDGWRIGHLFGFYGEDAEEKGRVFAEAAFTRARRILTSMGAPDYMDASVEVIGAEDQFGARRASPPSREVAVKMAARHIDPRAAGLLLREATGLGLSTPPGLTGFAGARPKPSPVMALFSFLFPKAEVEIVISDADGTETFIGSGEAVETAPMPPAEPVAEMAGDIVEVPLVDLAWTRSGDKGDSANIGVIARKAGYLPYIWAALDEDALRGAFGHFSTGRIDRFLLPGSNAMNVLIWEALGGGGIRSLRNDPQGKGYGQLALTLPVKIPAAVLEG